MPLPAIVPIAMGIASLGANLFGQSQQRKQQESAMEAQAQAQREQNEMLQKQQEDQQAQQVHQAAIASRSNELQPTQSYGEVYANGGLLNSSMPTNNTLTEYSGGGTHQQNPNGGIPIGDNNLVEDGESKFGNYIFSDRLKVGKNKTFSSAAKSLQNKYKRAEFDDNERRELESELSKLSQQQEFFKSTSQSPSSPNIMANGGELKKFESYEDALRHYRNEGVGKPRITDLNQTMVTGIANDGNMYQKATSPEIMNYLKESGDSYENRSLYNPNPLLNQDPSLNVVDPNVNVMADGGFLDKLKYLMTDQQLSDAAFRKAGEIIGLKPDSNNVPNSMKKAGLPNIEANISPNRPSLNDEVGNWNDNISPMNIQGWTPQPITTTSSTTPTNSAVPISEPVAQQVTPMNVPSRMQSAGAMPVSTTAQLDTPAPMQSLGLDEVGPIDTSTLAGDVSQFSSTPPNEGLFGPSGGLGGVNNLIGIGSSLIGGASSIIGNNRLAKLAEENKVDPFKPKSYNPALITHTDVSNAQDRRKINRDARDARMITADNIQKSGGNSASRMAALGASSAANTKARADTLGQSLQAEDQLNTQSRNRVAAQNANIQNLAMYQNQKDQINYNNQLDARNFRNMQESNAYRSAAWGAMPAMMRDINSQMMQQRMIESMGNHYQIDPNTYKVNYRG